MKSTIIFYFLKKWLLFTCVAFTVWTIINSFRIIFVDPLFKPQVRFKATPALRADDPNLTSILKQEALDSEYAKLWNTDI